MSVVYSYISINIVVAKSASGWSRWKRRKSQIYFFVRREGDKGMQPAVPTTKAIFNDHTLQFIRLSSLENKKNIYYTI